jgi:hypothetical protein
VAGVEVFLHDCQAHIRAIFTVVKGPQLAVNKRFMHQTRPINFRHTTSVKLVGLICSRSLVVAMESEEVGHVSALISDRNGSYHMQEDSNLRSDRRWTEISNEIVFHEVRRTQSYAYEV